MRRAIFPTGAAVLMAACGAKTLPAMPQSLPATIQGHGFTSLLPPTSQVPTGTVLELIDDAPMRIGVLCVADDAVGPGEGRVSDPHHAAARALSGATFTLEGPDLTDVFPAVAVEGISRVQVTFGQAVVVQLPQEAAELALREHRTSACQNALFAEGLKLATMVVTTLEADATLRVTVVGDANLDLAPLAEAWGPHATVEGTRIDVANVAWGALDVRELPYFELPGRRGVVEDVLPSNDNVTRIEPKSDRKGEANGPPQSPPPEEGKRDPK